MTEPEATAENLAKRISSGCWRLGDKWWPSPLSHNWRRPEYGRAKQLAVLDRSGVLLRVADAHFLVTAAHKLSRIASHGIPLYLPSPGPGEKPLPVSGGVGTEEKVVDVAVFNWIDLESMRCSASSDSSE